MISDLEYSKWLKMQTSRRVILIEYQYVIVREFPSSAEIKYGYAANAPYVSRPEDSPSSTAYDDILEGDIYYNRSVPVTFDGGSSISKGDIVLTITPEISGIIYEWFNYQPINIFLGDASWPKSDFRKVMSGTIKSKRVDGNQLILTFRDGTELLNVPFKRTYITSGPSEGEAIPLCFGQCFNISPLLIDEADYIYKVHDNWIHDVTDVRDDGVSVGFTWSFANATITLDNAPSGVVTCDVKGAAPPSGLVTGYKTSAADIAKAIILNYGVGVYGSGLGIDFEIDDDAFDDLTTNSGWTCGIYVTDTKTTLLETVEKLLRSIGAYLIITKTGIITVGQLAASAGAGITITPSEVSEYDVKIKAFIAPEYNVQLGYQKNWTIQNTVAGSVSEENKKIYSSPYSVTIMENVYVKAYYNGAQAGIETETMIATKTETDFECYRRLSLTSKPRTVYQLTVFNSVDQLDIGDRVKVDYSDDIIGSRLKDVFSHITGSYEQISSGEATIEVLV